MFARNASLVLVLVLLALSASPGEAQVVPEGFQPMDPPTEYTEWWQEAVESCNCTPATIFEHVSWYVVPGVTFFKCAESRGGCYGRWLLAGDKHFIIMSERGARDRARVIHEMLHAILQSPQHTGPFARAERMLVASW